MASQCEKCGVSFQEKPACTCSGCKLCQDCCQCDTGCCCGCKAQAK